MNKPDEHILMRFLQGTCNEEELAIVKLWADSSADNAAELFAMEREYHNIESVNIAKDKTEEALSKVLYRISAHDTAHTPHYNIGWLKYAAALAIVLLVGAGIVYKT